MGKNCTVVVVWNELTPYRLHVMQRVRTELPNIHVVNVFTHSVTNNSMPWKIEAGPDLDVRFEPGLRVPKPEQFLHRHALALSCHIAHIIEREKPVVMMLHGHNDLARVLLVGKVRRIGVPIVHLSDANMFDERYSVGIRQMARRRYLKWVLGRMDGYLPMGTGGRAFYRYFGLPGLPVFAFPYEPNYGAFTTRDSASIDSFRSRHGLRADRKRFLVSSRLVAVKRVGEIIRAFDQVARDLPDWDLVIAGDGPLRAELEAIALACLNPRVIFLGFMQIDELRHLYAACDVLVHNSAKEPWGLVINEAVASGMAIVAPDTTGAAVDLVRHRTNGFLFDVNSHLGLVDGMRYVADPMRLQELRRRAPGVLAEWREAADPVLGFRQAVEWFSSRRKQSPNGI